FHRAIIMSGGGRRSFLLRQMTGGTADKPSADMIGEEFANSISIMGTGSDALQRLRDKDASAIVNDLSFSNLLVAAWSDDPHKSLVMVDGRYVVGQPGDIICLAQVSGKVSEVGAMPVMVGTVAVDLPLFFPQLDDPYTYFGNYADEAREIYKKFLFPN